MNAKEFYIGNGHIRQLDSGRLELQIRYRDADGVVRRKSFCGDTQLELYDKAQAFASKETGSLATDNSTIPQILKCRFRRDKELNYVKEQTFQRKMETIKIIENHPIGAMSIRVISKHQMELFLASLTGYSNSTIGKVFHHLSTAYKIAVEEGIVEKNLMAAYDMKKPKSSKKNKKVRGMTEEEHKLFVQYLNRFKVPYGRNDYKLQLFIELYSGMRMGEINALTPDDIDLVGGVIHVSKTVARGKEFGTFISDSTKTGAGRRDVPISNTLRPYIEEALKKQKKNKHNLIFYDYNMNQIISTANVNSFFRRICISCGIEYNGQHALRHTFATRCIESGVPPVVLKTWLGHTNIHITLDTYADVFNRMNFAATEKLDSYLQDMKPLLA